MANIVAVTSGVAHTTTAGGRYYEDMSLVVMGNDRYVVTYGVGDDFNKDETGADIRAQIFGTNGSLIRGEFDLTALAGGGQETAKLVATEDGGFAAAWYARYLTVDGNYFNFNGAPDHIRYRYFDADGDGIGAEQTWEPAPGSTTFNAGYVALASYGTGGNQDLIVGSWAAGSASYPTVDNNGDVVILRPSAGASTVTGGVMPGSQVAPTMSSFATGPMVSVAWTGFASGVLTVSGGQINGVTGAFSGGWTFNASSGAQFFTHDRQLETASLAGGQTAVAYLDGGGVPRLRIYNADGTGGTPIDIKYSEDPTLPATNYAGGAVGVQALPDGGVIVAWQQFATNYSGGVLPVGIYMRTYDASGTPSGAAVLVDDFNGNTVVSLYDIDISIGDDGAIVVAWNWSNSGFTNYEVGSRVFRLGIERSGTTGADVMVALAGAEVFKGLGGTDMVSYQSATSGVTASLAGVAQNTGFAAGDSYVDIENLRGSLHDDVLSGNGAANLLEGLSGNDTLMGDTGADTLSGGVGLRDMVDYSGSDAAVTIVLSNAATQSGGDAQGDRLLGIEDVFGTIYADSLTGSNAANTLNGSIGNDVLSGLGGNDSLDGGFGNDSLNGGTGEDTLNGDLGTDTVFYSTSTARVTVNLATGVATGSGQGTGDTLIDIENVVGSSFNDIITGDTIDNQLNGGAGNDVVNAGDGDDTLVGGTGDDTLNGGAGLDRINGGLGNDLMNGSSTINQRDTFLFTDMAFGQDTIVAFQSSTDKFDMRAIGLDYSDFTVSQQGADTWLVLTADINQNILLKNVLATTIDASDFLT